MEENQKQNPKKKNIQNKKSRKVWWIISVTASSFVLSGGLLFASASALEGVSVYIAILIVLAIIMIGILFDTIGISVAGAKISVFHSMAAQKLYGAKKAIWLVNNSDKVSSICNDVIGDICGVISGAASTLIIISILGNMQNDPKSWPSLIVSGAVAALTVGGKAIGKTIAVKNGNQIVYKAAVILRFFSGKRNLGY